MKSGNMLGLQTVRKGVRSQGLKSWDVKVKFAGSLIASPISSVKMKVAIR